MRVLFILILLAASLASCWNTVEDQARKLGTREFTPETWAKATDLQRGEMTASLLKKHDVTSYHRKEIVALLGEPTGYYDYDTNPAYFVGPTTVESMYGKGYLLVFLTDKSNGDVDSVMFFPEVE